VLPAYLRRAGAALRCWSGSMAASAAAA